MSMKNRDEQIKMQGARSAATGMYFMYMRIAITAQRSRLIAQ